ncbi:DEAD/DEAH box helicase family protein [Methylobacterium sp. Leaf100]|uniref:BPTD_3080 family restriction endonuclease n=1 Tax=Methylobacterium sp. Leaf100 TaxID=1736252 RepID=UPI0006F2560B|nr:DEAD/DEAH box helicase family protein [Methylobacterium sp. Leaf100]KQP28814.1 restriction endonuclease [Methylobacterium sp. Leaf100]
MATPFFERPILNSPYKIPTQHHALDSDGQPLDQEPAQGRRRSSLITPVPKSKKQRGRGRQTVLGLGDGTDLSTVEQAYNPTPIINEIRGHVASWRSLPNPADWGVTPTTQRLLQHWRREDGWHGPRPFFCQVEAVETAIWLTEVAGRQRQYAHILRHIEGANEGANPGLPRLALKMATGAGKTTVMAMLVAWQTINAVRSPNAKHFTRGFLLVTPGITIRDRLRVLMPGDPDAYYSKRELVPTDMLHDLGQAKIVLTNYHAFKRRETLEISKVGRSLLQGRHAPIDTIESEGAMLQRVCRELMPIKNLVVINDEAHHCYREKPDGADENPVAAEDREEAKRNAEAARLWISGIESLKRKVGVRAVYDLSATPFFLRGSGYLEGTLFPWTVSDFSLIDAIECGIVKLPRVPIADNAASGEVPLYRELWEHIGKAMPKKGAGKTGTLDPLSHVFPSQLQTALHALYGHYEKTSEVWERAGIDVPPVFIVVCNNTATSKLVYEWIAGFERPNAEGESETRHVGHLRLFRNYDDNRQRLAKPNTLLIDSEQLESGEALDPAFREMAAAEIEQFRRERIERGVDAVTAAETTDADLLREVMNTVGRKGRLGERIRCVVSVSMLTEGWDANTVTHILGVRAFGTQLLCEQVVGRGLRRQSYELNDAGLFNVEYADILGIPFSFTVEPVVSVPAPPRKLTRVQALRERVELEIGFPRVEGYRVDLPNERLSASFTDDSRLTLTPETVGPAKVHMSGIVGEQVTLDAEDSFRDMRPSEMSFKLAKRLLETRLRDPDGDLPVHLFGQAQRVVRQWLDGGYLVAQGVPRAAVLYPQLAEQAVEFIYLACQRSVSAAQRIKAVLDPYNPAGSTRFVSFTTSKPVWETDPRRCHVSHVVLDSDWEGELARVLEAHPRVLSYVKNQGLGFEVPYRDGAVPRRYLPDFIVRLDDGRPEPLNLILETKGYRGTDAQLKAETMDVSWVPGVNALTGQGRWAFFEFREVFVIEETFAELVDKLVKEEIAA